MVTWCKKKTKEKKKKRTEKQNNKQKTSGVKVVQTEKGPEWSHHLHVFSFHTTTFSISRLRPFGLCDCKLLTQL